MTVVAKRTLGRTGLDISELAIGGGVVGGILPLGEPDAQQRLLSLALASGINWIDTAAAYGRGKSETALGLLLANIPGAHRPHIATKFRLDPTNLNDISGHIEASVTASLKRLQLSSVTLLQLHNPLGGRQRAAGGQALALDDVEKTGGVLDAMEALKAQGLTRHIGFTALGVPDSCRRLIESGRIDTAPGLLQSAESKCRPNGRREMVDHRFRATDRCLRRSRGRRAGDSGVRRRGAGNPRTARA